MLRKVTSGIFLLIFLIIIAGCGKQGHNNKVSQGNIGSDNSSNMQSTDVKVLKVTLQDVKDIYTVPGVAQAWEVVSVPTQTSGPISWKGLEEGDLVTSGEPILKVNTENLTANLNNAKVQLDSKDKDFKRTKNLYLQSSVSQKNYDDAKDALSIAKVNYDLALEEYNKSVVKSPVNGVLDSITPNLGEYVAPGTVVATVVTMNKLKIYVDIPEKDVPFLKIGQEVDVYTADMASNPKKIKGKINFISVTSDPKTLTYKARIDLDNQTIIKPGIIIRADIVRRDLKNVILVDIYSVTDKNGEKYVFLDHKGKAEERKVDVGPMIDQNVVINSGLAVGDNLIVSGQQFLFDGAPVKTQE